ncbi:MAG: MmcQ/YjbR family DNA-binding protein [Armatimonadota bacterium]|nr:MmcQ/YjbR family DNA-binding protein [Armatimonadota bacterium]MDR7493835.1 MmcQ/YjbR family DNA-binding protein [Armatimonadota bacterium]MDR7572828.1 MmcQ/YjbR family DNA-binding protein [Armatimonadota bacterium]
MKIDRVRRFALSLPEATEEPHSDKSSFRVKGKIFATVPPDGRHLHVFVDEEHQDLMVSVELLRSAWQRKVRIGK